jgi:hypothetical protein
MIVAWVVERLELTGHGGPDERGASGVVARVDVGAVIDQEIDLRWHQPRGGP